MTGLYFVWAYDTAPGMPLWFTVHLPLEVVEITDGGETVTAGAA